jgi:hypothetical protein
VSTFTFAPAVRKRVKLKALITGPSGAGKTIAALSLGTAIAPEKVALIDSEHDRSEYYADAFRFDKLALPNHHVNTYIGALNAAAEAGYTIVVIDSLTHAWEDVLERKSAEEKANPRANSYTLWNKYGEQWNDLVRAILESPVHVICTARSKQAYEQTERNGKKVVDKLGMAPILRDGTEYEFALVFDISPSHRARVSKDNTNQFDSDEYYDLTDVGLARKLVAWLDGGAEAPAVKAPAKWTQPAPEPEPVNAAPVVPLDPLTLAEAEATVMPEKLGGKAMGDTKIGKLQAFVTWAESKDDLSAHTLRTVAGARLVIAKRESEIKAAEAGVNVGAYTPGEAAKLLDAQMDADEAGLPF